MKREIDGSSPAIQAWFQKYADSPVTAYFHENKNWVWLHVAILDSSRDKLAILGKKLLPAGIPPIDPPRILGVIPGGGCSRKSAPWEICSVYELLHSARSDLAAERANFSFQPSSDRLRIVRFKS